MTPVTVRFDGGFDWELLHEQKQELRARISEEFGELRDEPHPLDYILAIIDEIQEQAAEAGEPVVFEEEDFDDDNIEYEEGEDEDTELSPVGE
jgi:hypothetical protein